MSYVSKEEYDRVCDELKRYKTEALQARRAQEKTEVRVVMREAARKAGVPEGSLPYVFDAAFDDGWGLDSKDKPCLKVNDRVMEYQDPVEWIKDKRAAKPHWWADASGGAADTTVNGGTNPFVEGPGWNLTKQCELIREKPTLAKQMAAAAGVKLQLD